MKTTLIDEGNKETERIIDTLLFFSTNNTTIISWISETQQHYNYCEAKMFLYTLLVSGFIIIELDEKELCENKLPTEFINKIVYVSKEGYAFLNSYKFNKQSIALNKQSLQISKEVKIISLVALVISLTSLIFSVCR